MIKSKKQMFIVIGGFMLALLLGTTTFAFFNYTRTGVANTIQTGRIYFNTSQSDTLNLTNVFPISSTQAGNTNLDAVSIRIWGDTTYSGGEEFEISIVDVNNTIGSGGSAKTIPINYIASYSATPVQSGDPNVIGESSGSYFTARGQSSAVYQLKTTGEAVNGEQVLIGFIPSGATGIDGTLTIKAYLDSSKVAISDTYPEGEITHTEGEEPNQETITDYYNGTTNEWVGDRVVLTTSEWNALQNTETPLSFKIRAESREGTWVEEPSAGDMIPSCPGCVFMYTTNSYDYGTNGATLEDIELNGDTYSDDYNDVITNSRAHFLGFTISNGHIDRAFACGSTGPTVNNDAVFCIEATTVVSDQVTVKSRNDGVLQEAYGEHEPPYCTQSGVSDGFLCSVDGERWVFNYPTNVVVATVDYEEAACEVRNGQINCYE